MSDLGHASVTLGWHITYHTLGHKALTCNSVKKSPLACRPCEEARAAAEAAYEDLVHKCVQMRRVHDSVRLQYHRLMRAATAEEAALLHSHNDSIRFLSWLFALMKVCSGLAALPSG